MSLDAITRVQARIASIEARIQDRVSQVAPGSAGGALGAGATTATTATTGSVPAGTAAAETPFGSILDQAMQAQGLGSTSLTATRRAPGSYGALTPPADLAGYGNGRVPATALAPLGIGDHRLWAPAAQAFQQMAADARRAGVSIGVTDSYRSYQEQVHLAEEKGLHRHGGLAAVPGTSNHGWGVALDLDLDAEAQAWMRANAHRYGFVEDVPREPWHWTFRPGA